MQPLQLMDPASGTCTYILHDPHTRDALIIDPVDAQIERDLAVLQTRGLRLCWAVETHNHADHITSAGLLAEHAGARTAAPAGCGMDTAQKQLADGDVLAFGGEQLRALHTPGHTAGSMCYLWRGHVFTGDTLVWPGHGYGGRSHSSIAAGRSEADFAALMQGPVVRQAQGYAGDVPPALAWQWVQAGEAVLVDVRSDAERAWVGEVPGAIPVAWKQWPGMAPNPGFDAQICAAVPQGRKALLLCRSGVRSIAAAQQATRLGLEAWNVLEGFEGDPDGNAHRGQRGGWRYRGLPWRQS